MLYLWQALGAQGLRRIDRKRWIAYINAHQRPDGDYANPDHGRYHRFAYTLGALSLLGGKPGIRPAYLPPTEPAALRSYLIGLPWERSIQKHLWGAFYPLACSWGPDSAWGEVFTHEMDARLDVDTGWQRTRRHLPNWRYVSQLYHTLVSYDALGRDFPQAEALLVRLLARGYHKGAVFARARTACTEMDWIWLMEKLAKQLPHRWETIRDALLQMTEAFIREWSDRPGRFLGGTTHSMAAMVIAIARLVRLFPERFRGQAFADSWNDHSLYRLPDDWLATGRDAQRQSHAARPEAAGSGCSQRMCPCARYLSKS